MIWAAATGDFSESNLLLGFVVGFILIIIVQRATGRGTYAQRTWHVVGFVLFFLRELVIANLRVAYDVIMLSENMRAGFVAVPLSASTDFEIMLLANLISLTPGSLSIDISGDHKVLYLHAMYVADPEALRHEIKAGFERRLLQVTR